MGVCRFRSMDHLTTENIITYLDGKATDAEKRTVQAHLAVCAECIESMRQIESVEVMLREEPSFEPPDHLVERWMNVFRTTPVPKPEKTASLPRMIASLVFDSFVQPVLVFERGLGPRPHQKIFRAGDIDVDVKIQSVGTGEQISLEGQVLDSSTTFLDDVAVCLESHGVVRYRTRTNKVGEFSFEVPNETYHLSIRLPEVEIAIFGVHRTAAKTN